MGGNIPHHYFYYIGSLQDLYLNIIELLEYPQFYTYVDIFYHMYIWINIIRYLYTEIISLHM